MKEDKTIDSYSLRFTGKVELPKELKQNTEYIFAIRGDIRGYQDRPNDDGTYSATYIGQLINVEVLDPLGETIKSKDKTSESQKNRAMLKMTLDELGSEEDFDEAYTNFNQWLRSNKLHALVVEYLEYKNNY